MDIIGVRIGGEVFAARFQDELAPETCARFRTLLPWSQQLIHVRWSGEGCWIPLGNFDLGLPHENAANHPQPGQFVLYPGGKSETEVLLSYRNARFGSKAGQLAGNPFLIITERLDQLAEIGRAILWHGVRQIQFG